MAKITKPDKKIAKQRQMIKITLSPMKKLKKHMTKEINAKTTV